MSIVLLDEGRGQQHSQLDARGLGGGEDALDERVVGVPGCDALTAPGPREPTAQALVTDASSSSASSKHTRINGRARS